MNVSTPIVSDAEDGSTTAEDQASCLTDESPEVIEVCSDDEGMDELKKELGMPRHPFFLSLSLISILSSSPENLEVPNIFIFKNDVTIQEHKGCVAHFFTCSAAKCRSEAGGVRRYQDTADKLLTANLRCCFGEDTVNTAVRGEPGTSQSGNIINCFTRQGLQPVAYSHRAHTTPEFW